MSHWSTGIVESMSTEQLYAALQAAHAQEPAEQPPERLLTRMHEEWNDRPAFDRIVAEDHLHHDVG
ncbi:MAG: hypothetical protein QOJ26_93 [Thermoplasmata archaeon]|jgi:hypothetical protein|nr:hypothetical protein [Thermoplasmata archaeon]MEA3165249.1 hypothetical protein [Thermoplasmata archaeon]